MRKIRVLLADDHAIVREGLRSLINSQSEMEVIGEAPDGHSALTMTEDLDPDVVVVDVSMPDLNGAQVTTQLRAIRPDRKVLVLTVHEDKGYLRLLLEAGASGYVLKRAAAAELVQAIRAVAGGGTYLDPSLASSLVDKGIRVNAVAPGPVWTPLNPADQTAEQVAEFGQQTDFKRPAQPEELSPAYVFLASPVCSSYITGIVLPVTGSVGS